MLKFVILITTIGGAFSCFSFNLEPLAVIDTVSGTPIAGALRENLAHVSAYIISFKIDFVNDMISPISEFFLILIIHTSLYVYSHFQ